MVDSQKMATKASSGGLRIDQHGFFAGSGSPTFPKGVHVKDYSSAEGDGSIMRYEDTSERVKEMQVEGVKQAKSKPMKPTYRN